MCHCLPLSLLHWYLHGYGMKLVDYLYDYIMCSIVYFDVANVMHSLSYVVGPPHGVRLGKNE